MSVEDWPWPANTPGQVLLCAKVGCPSAKLFEALFSTDNDFQLNCVCQAKWNQARNVSNYMESPWVGSAQQLPTPQFQWQLPKPQPTARLTAGMLRRVRYMNPASALLRTPFDSEETQKIELCIPGEAYVVGFAIMTTAPYGDRIISNLRMSIRKVDAASSNLTVAFTVQYCKPVGMLLKPLVQKGAEGGFRASFQMFRKSLEEMFTVETISAQDEAATGSQVTAEPAPADEQELQSPGSPLARAASLPASPYPQLVLLDHRLPQQYIAPVLACRTTRAVALSSVAAVLAVLAAVHLLLLVLHRAASVVHAQCIAAPSMWVPLCTATAAASQYLPSSTLEVCVAVALVAAANWMVLTLAAGVSAVAVAAPRTMQQLQRLKQLRLPFLRRPAPQLAPEAEASLTPTSTSTAPALPSTSAAATELPVVAAAAVAEPAAPPADGTPAEQPAHQSWRDVTGQQLSAIGRGAARAWSALASSSASAVRSAGTSMQSGTASRSSSGNMVSGPAAQHAVEAALEMRVLSPTISEGDGDGEGLMSRSDDGSATAMLFENIRIEEDYAQVPLEALSPHKAASSAGSSGAAEDEAGHVAAKALHAPVPSPAKPVVPGEENEDVVLEEIFENERFQPFRGWGHTWPGHFLPSDGVGHWSTLSGGPRGSASMVFDKVAPLPPKGWAWQGPDWAVDMTGREEDCVDADGWCYAVDFKWLRYPPGPGSGRLSMKSFVRRRRWVRARVRAAIQSRTSDVELVALASTDGVLPAEDSELQAGANGSLATLANAAGSSPFSGPHAGTAAVAAGVAAAAPVRDRPSGRSTDDVEIASTASGTSGISQRRGMHVSSHSMDDIARLGDPEDELEELPVGSPPEYTASLQALKVLRRTRSMTEESFLQSSPRHLSYAPQDAADAPVLPQVEQQEQALPRASPAEGMQQGLPEASPAEGMQQGLPEAAPAEGMQGDGVVTGTTAAVTQPGAAPIAATSSSQKSSKSARQRKSSDDTDRPRQAAPQLSADAPTDTVQGDGSMRDVEGGRNAQPQTEPVDASAWECAWDASWGAEDEVPESDLPSDRTGVDPSIPEPNGASEPNGANGKPKQRARGRGSRDGSANGEQASSKPGAFEADSSLQASQPPVPGPADTPQALSVPQWSSSTGLQATDGISPARPDLLGRSISEGSAGLSPTAERLAGYEAPRRTVSQEAVLTSPQRAHRHPLQPDSRPSTPPDPTEEPSPDASPEALLPPPPSSPDVLKLRSGSFPGSSQAPPPGVTARLMSAPALARIPSGPATEEAPAAAERPASPRILESRIPRPASPAASPTSASPSSPSPRLAAKQSGMSPRQAKGGPARPVPAAAGVASEAPASPSALSRITPALQLKPISSAGTEGETDGAGHAGNTAEELPSGKVVLAGSQAAAGPAGKTTAADAKPQAAASGVPGAAQSTTDQGDARAAVAKSAGQVTSEAASSSKVKPAPGKAAATRVAGGGEPKTTADTKATAASADGLPLDPSSERSPADSKSATAAAANPPSPAQSSAASQHMAAASPSKASSESLAGTAPAQSPGSNNIAEKHSPPVAARQRKGGARGSPAAKPPMGPAAPAPPDAAGTAGPPAPVGKHSRDPSLTDAPGRIGSQSESATSAEPADGPGSSREPSTTEESGAGGEQNTATQVRRWLGRLSSGLAKSGSQLVAATTAAAAATTAAAAAATTGRRNASTSPPLARASRSLETAGHSAGVVADGGASSTSPAQAPLETSQRRGSAESHEPMSRTASDLVNSNLLEAVADLMPAARVLEALDSFGTTPVIGSPSSTSLLLSPSRSPATSPPPTPPPGKAARATPASSTRTATSPEICPAQAAPPPAHTTGFKHQTPLGNILTSMRVGSPPAAKPTAAAARVASPPPAKPSAAGPRTASPSPTHPPVTAATASSPAAHTATHIASPTASMPSQAAVLANPSAEKPKEAATPAASPSPSPSAGKSKEAATHAASPSPPAVKTTASRNASMELPAASAGSAAASPTAAGADSSGQASDQVRRWIGRISNNLSRGSSQLVAAMRRSDVGGGHDEAAAAVHQQPELPEEETGTPAAAVPEAVVPPPAATAATGMRKRGSPQK